MKQECSEIGAHFLNLWLAHYEAISKGGNYFLDPEDEDNQNRFRQSLNEIQDELNELGSQNLITEEETKAFQENLIEILLTLPNEPSEVRAALDKGSKKAYNMMFNKFAECECGEALAIEEQLGKEALSKILAGAKG